MAWRNHHHRQTPKKRPKPSFVEIVKPAHAHLSATVSQLTQIGFHENEENTSEGIEFDPAGNWPTFWEGPGSKFADAVRVLEKEGFHSPTPIPADPKKFKQFELSKPGAGKFTVWLGGYGFITSKLFNRPRNLTEIKYEPEGYDYDREHLKRNKAEIAAMYRE